MNIGVSSSGKTQHFDCCIREFESRRPSQKATTIFVRRLPLLLCFSPFLSTILLAFCYAVRFLIYIRRRNYRLKIRRREPTVFISPSLRLRLVSRRTKTLYHSFSSFFKENGSYHFTTQGKISNGQ